MKSFRMKKHAVLSLIFMGTLMILLGSISTVHATDVVEGKGHLPPSAFRDPSGTFDGYTPGAMICFHMHLNVTNGSPPAPVSISDLNVTDDLPNLPGTLYMTYVSGSQNSSSQLGPATFTDFGNGTLFWNFGAGPFITPVIAPPPFSNATQLFTASVTFNATINSNVPDNTTLINNAVAMYKETQSGGESAPSTSDKIWVTRPILDIIKQNPASVVNGSAFNYVLTLNNTGYFDATGFNVTDFLPSGVTHTPGTSTATSGSFAVDSGTQVVWTGKIGNVTGAHTVTITIPVTANTPATSVFNLANYTAFPSYAQFTHAQASCTTGVQHPAPAISLTKTANPSRPQTPPANFTYTYVVTNIGDVPLSGVTVYDQTFNALILGPVTLSVGQSATGTFGPVTYPNVGYFTNIANATGRDQTGAVVEAFANAQVRTRVLPVGGKVEPVDTMMVLFAAIENTLLKYWVAAPAVGAIAALIIFKRRRR